MKLIAFFLVYFSILVSLAGYRVSWRSAFWISILYVVFLRQGGFQGDFQVYLDELNSGWLSIYYFREPLFWIGSKLLYTYIGSEQVVIFLYDFLFCIVLCKALRKVSSPNVFLLVLVSFPVFLGLENVYRQVLGLPFALLFFYHSLNRNVFLSLVYILVASLFHNSSILLSPMFVFCAQGISYSIKFLMVFVFFSVAGFVVSYFGFSAGLVGKSSAQSTGLELEFLYLVVTIFLSFFIPILFNRLKAEWFLFAFIVNCILFLSIGYLGSAQSERVGMIFLVLLFYSCFCIFGFVSKSGDFIVKVQMFFVLSAPVFLFSSTRGFLMAGGF